MLVAIPCSLVHSCCKCTFWVEPVEFSIGLDTLGIQSFRISRERYPQIFSLSPTHDLEWNLHCEICFLLLVLYEKFSYISG